MQVFMPIIQNGSYYVFRQSGKNRQKSAKVMVFVMFLAIVFCVGLSFFAFSKINFANKFGLNNFLIFEHKTYFAVSVCQGEKESVLPNQQPLKMSGGAGYVMQQDEKYFLLANIYDSIDDAQKVCQNLTSFEAEVVKIDLPRLVLGGDYSSQQISVLKYCLNVVGRAYKTLSEISQSFDRGEILEGEAKQKLQVFGTSCQEDKQSLSNVFGTNCDNIVVCAKIFLNETISNISACGLSTNFASDIKQCLINTIFDFANFQKSISKGE